MHGLLVFTHITRVFTECEENDLLHMLVKAAEIWGYLMAICYLQFYTMVQTVIDRNSLNTLESQKTQYIKDWIVLEVFVFYGRIFNSVLFLLYIQLRGFLGYTDHVEKEDRFKFDALDYYEIDINWSCFQTVPIIQMVNFLWRVQIQDDLSINK